MQPNPEKNFVNRKLASDNADRLKRLCSLEFPFFSLLGAVARRMGEQERQRHNQKVSAPSRPAYRKITAVVILGLDSFQEFDTCSILVDEELTPSQVRQRRDDQARRLLELFKSHAAEIEFRARRDLKAEVYAFLEIWQPSAKEYSSLNEFLVTPGELNDTAYGAICRSLEAACRTRVIPSRRELAKGQAFLVLHFYQGFTSESLPPNANDLAQNLGILATYLVNENMPAKIRQGLRMFQLLWAHGHIPAGLHLAQTCLQYLDDREYHEYGAGVVEDVWKAWMREPGQFTMRESIQTLYQLRARAMAEIVRLSDSDDEIGVATETLIHLYEEATANCFKGWPQELRELLMGQCQDISGVDPQSIDALRARIQQFPSARAVWEARRERFIQQSTSAIKFS